MRNSVVTTQTCTMYPKKVDTRLRRRSISRQKSGFLLLPGELRNHIYRYYFESGLCCKMLARRLSSLDPGRTCNPRSWHSISHLGNPILRYEYSISKERHMTISSIDSSRRYDKAQDVKVIWSSSLYALSMVCKQVYKETVTLLYTKTEFVFDASKRLNGFLDHISRPKLECITKLQLCYITYGCPRWNEDIIWQEKHRRSWNRACKAASKNLYNLRELKLGIQVNESPLRFNLKERWLQPLLQFRRLTCAQSLGPIDLVVQRLQVVDVDLRSQIWGSHFDGNLQLAAANKDLHQLFGRAISLAILGAKEEAAMGDFNTGWTVTHSIWRYHLGFAKTGW